VTAVLPVSGPSDGGTTVTVTGSEFMTLTTKCKFGTSVSTANTVQSSSLMICVALAQPTARVNLELSNNNQDYTASRVVYYFYRMLV
jgi:hypothetical protein